MNASVKSIDMKCTLYDINHPDTPQQITTWGTYHAAIREPFRNLDKKKIHLPTTHSELARYFNFAFLKGANKRF